MGSQGISFPDYVESFHSTFLTSDTTPAVDPDEPPDLGGVRVDREVKKLLGAGGNDPLRASNSDWGVNPHTATLEGVNAANLKAISNVSTDSPPVITTSSTHGLRDGDTVEIKGIVGAVQANGYWIARALSSTTFTIYNFQTGSACVAPSAYVSGGLVRRVMPPQIVDPEPYLNLISTEMGEFDSAVDALDEQTTWNNLKDVAVGFANEFVPESLDIDPDPVSSLDPISPIEAPPTFAKLPKLKPPSGLTELIEADHLIDIDLPPTVVSDISVDDSPIGPITYAPIEDDTYDISRHLISLHRQDVDEEIEAFKDRSKIELAKAYNRIMGGFAGANAVEGTALPTSLALLEAERQTAIRDYEIQRRNQDVLAHDQFVLERERLGQGADALHLEQDRAALERHKLRIEQARTEIELHRTRTDRDRLKLSKAELELSRAGIFIELNKLVIARTELGIRKFQAAVEESRLSLEHRQIELEEIKTALERYRTGLEKQRTEIADKAIVVDYERVKLERDRVLTEIERVKQTRAVVNTSIITNATSDMLALLDMKLRYHNAVVAAQGEVSKARIIGESDYQRAVLTAKLDELYYRLDTLYEGARFIGAASSIPAGQRALSERERALSGVLFSGGAALLAGIYTRNPGIGAAVFLGGLVVNSVIGGGKNG